MNIIENLESCDIEYWMKLDKWKLSESACILAGYEPSIEALGFGRASEIYMRIGSCFGSVAYKSDKKISPKKIIRWAKKDGLISKDMKGILKRYKEDKKLDEIEAIENSDTYWDDDDELDPTSPDVFIHMSSIPPSCIDANGHVSNYNPVMTLHRISPIGRKLDSVEPSNVGQSKQHHATKSLANSEVSSASEQAKGANAFIQNEVKSTKTKSKPGWVSEAKQLASEYIKLWRSAQYAPTGEDAAVYVATVFLNTGKGKLKWATIKKEALTGITNRKPGFKAKRKVPSDRREGLPE